MVTEKQKMGELGEIFIVKNFVCPKCKNENTLKRLPTNFKCADIICDFCGYLAQVKTSRKKDINKLPKSILGAAWSVQKERMDAGIYFPLFFVIIDSKDDTNIAVYYLSADLQTRDLFIPRNPLAEKAKGAGWQGFIYDLSKIIEGSFVRLI